MSISLSPLEHPLPEPEEAQKTNGGAEGEWETVDDGDEDEESKAIVDQVLC